jgi:hypothetical protein
MAKKLGTFSTASTSNSIKVADQFTHVFTVNVTNYVSPTNVRIEFSYDNLIWYNVTDYDYVITGNDTYNLIVTKNLPISNLRFVFVSGESDCEVLYLNY